MTTVINQIDYSERDVGKMNPESKREVAFRFSVNGKEYDLLLAWSFSSGKQSIFVNGIEECFSRNGASLIDTKFEFDEVHFHLIGTRTHPKGKDLPISLRRQKVNPSSIYCTRTMPVGSEELRLLPNLWDTSTLVPAGGSSSRGLRSLLPKMSLPADRPMANSAPDLLLDFNPIGIVSNYDNSTPSSDFLVPTEQPTYNNYNVFSQPQTDAFNSFGGQMQVAHTYGSGALQPDASNLFGGQMAMANTYGPPPTSMNDASNPFGGHVSLANTYGPPPTTTNDASNPFGGQMTVASSYGSPPTTTNDASNPFVGSPALQTTANQYSYSAPAQQSEAVNSFGSGLSSMQPVATNNYNSNDAQPPSTADASPLFGGAPRPPTSPVYGFNAGGYPAPNPYESSNNSASHGAAVDPFSQFGVSPVPYNAM